MYSSACRPSNAFVEGIVGVSAASVILWADQVHPILLSALYALTIVGLLNAALTVSVLAVTRQSSIKATDKRVAIVYDMLRVAIMVASIVLGIYFGRSGVG